MTLKFLDEPPASLGRQSNKYQDEAAQLRKNVGKWALVKTFEKKVGAGAFATQVRTGKLSAFRTGKWEARQVGFDVYVRFTGE